MKLSVKKWLRSHNNVNVPKEDPRGGFGLTRAKDKICADLILMIIFLITSYCDGILYRVDP